MKQLILGEATEILAAIETDDGTVTTADAA